MTQKIKRSKLNWLKRVENGDGWECVVYVFLCDVTQSDYIFLGEIFDAVLYQFTNGKIKKSDKGTLKVIVRTFPYRILLKIKLMFRRWLNGFVLSNRHQENLLQSNIFKSKKTTYAYLPKTIQFGDLCGKYFAKKRIF